MHAWVRPRVPATSKAAGGDKTQHIIAPKTIVDTVVKNPTTRHRLAKRRGVLDLVSPHKSTSTMDAQKATTLNEKNAPPAAGGGYIATMDDTRHMNPHVHVAHVRDRLRSSTLNASPVTSIAMDSRGCA
jgi:hypothetical protein